MVTDTVTRGKLTVSSVHVFVKPNQKYSENYSKIDADQSSRVVYWPLSYFIKTVLCTHVVRTYETRLGSALRLHTDTNRTNARTR